MSVGGTWEGRRGRPNCETHSGQYVQTVSSALSEENVKKQSTRNTRSLRGYWTLTFLLAHCRVITAIVNVIALNLKVLAALNEGHPSIARHYLKGLFNGGPGGGRIWVGMFQSQRR